MTETICKFESKKNDVRCQDGRVIKRFENEKSFMREVACLKKFQSLNVPQIVSFDKTEKVVETEFVAGNLLIDEFMTATIKRVRELADMVADFIVGFNTIDPTLIAGDENFRNYIVDGKKLYRLDFENAKKGNVLKSLSMLSSFCCCYDTSIKKQCAFVRQLVSHFDILIEDFVVMFKKDLIFLSKRQKKDFPKSVYLMIKSVL